MIRTNTDSPTLSEARAVDAWRGLGGSGALKCVEVLSGGKHSRVFRLVGAGPGGAPVIAKLVPHGEQAVDRLLHQVILPALAVRTPTCYGFVEGDARNEDVLFLQDVGNRAFDPSEQLHREAAARWLARLHTEGVGAAMQPLIPTKTPESFVALRLECHEGLQTGLANPALSDSERTLAQSLIALLDEVEDQWSELARAWYALPTTLVHGAFIARNCRMVEENGRLEAIAFDWEHVAVASPALDLVRSYNGSTGFGASADLATYASCLGDRGTRATLSLVSDLARLGTVCRALTTMSWVVPRLSDSYVARAFSSLSVYRHHLERALEQASDSAG